MSKVLTLTNYAAAAAKIADGLNSIPSKVSELTNDSGYLTKNEAASLRTTNITDADTGTVYSGEIQIIDGKPYFVYDDEEEEA